MFLDDERIRLSPDHLQVCIGSIEEWKLFNSNLDVIDDAFEYLANKSSKGEKGQYFTPRWVIDMCVKMLNPQEHETVIDTACGSAGFTVHAMFHVWRQIIDDLGLPQSNLFTMEEKPARCIDYVKGKVFASDFDEKSVRVSRCLNLIAGDGEANVLHLNTLDWTKWDEFTKQDDWNDTYGGGFSRLRKIREKPRGKDYRRFQFHVLMANPPFAGDIKQSDMLSPYELAHKRTGQLESGVGRDLLFIERNLDFLRSGGRMAIVLPQGRFNNSSDHRVREFIMDRCRILAVVGLHPNTFKPHTGAKTSVLFVQDDIRVLFVGLYYRGQRRTDLEREYLDVYHPINEAIPRQLQLPAGQLVPIPDLYTAEELKTSPTYNESLPRYKYQHGLNVLLDGPGAPA